MIAYIIDDEENNTEVLELMLHKHCKQITTINCYNDSKKGLAAIEEKQPDILFLDIEMPGLNGFDLLNKLSDVKFQLIFTTAYDKYAIKAFKYSAIDYLLKPIDKTELIASVEKAVHSKTSDSQLKLLQDSLHESIHEKKESPSRIAISVSEGIVFIKTADIIHCKSDSNYTTLFMKESKKLTASKTLKDIEELLGDEHFIRVHSSHLVNKNEIQMYQRSDGGELLMSNGTLIPISRDKKSSFLESFTKI